MNARPEASLDLPAGDRVDITVRAVLEINDLATHLIEHQSTSHSVDFATLHLILTRISHLACAATSALTDDMEVPESIHKRTFGGKP